jgi:tetratricopeptide (TPR) repeat protein
MAPLPLLSLALAATLGLAPPAPPAAAAAAGREARPPGPPAAAAAVGAPAGVLARGAAALRAGRLAEAEAAYRRALAAAPGSAPALHGLGSALFRAGRRAEGLGHLRAAAAAAPAEAALQRDLGLAALATGDAAGAAAAYARALALAPDVPEAHYGLGEARARTGALAGALAAFEQGLSLEAGAGGGPPERARQRAEALRAALAASPPPAGPPGPLPGRAEPRTAPLPEGARPHPALAQQRVREGDSARRVQAYRTAAFAYQDAHALDPGSAEAAFKLARVLVELGYPAQAAALWREAQALAPDAEVRRRAAVNLARAEALAATAGRPVGEGRGPSAVQALPEPLRQRAHRAYEEGLRRLAERQGEAAVRQLGEALSIDPAMSVARIARANALLGLRRYEEAAADASYALAQLPDAAAPLFGLAEAYAGLGRLSEARPLYARYATSAASDARPDLQREARQKAEGGP